MTPDDPPETPALDAWYEAHRRGRDNAKVDLWFPEEAPWAHLDTISVGCDEPVILPEPSKPTVHLNFGPTISIGGYLSDMEAYIAAAQDALRVARWHADRIAAEQAAEREANDGR